MTPRSTTLPWGKARNRRDLQPAAEREETETGTPPIADEQSTTRANTVKPKPGHAA